MTITITQLILITDFIFIIFPKLLIQIIEKIKIGRIQRCMYGVLAIYSNLIIKLDNCLSDNYVQISDKKELNFENFNYDHLVKNQVVECEYIFGTDP